MNTYIEVKFSAYDDTCGFHHFDVITEPNGQPTRLTMTLDEVSELKAAYDRKEPLSWEKQCIVNILHENGQDELDNIDPAVFVGQSYGFDC